MIRGAVYYMNSLKFYAGLCLLGILVLNPSFAAPTAAQIEFFKTLPADQQQALIQQQTGGKIPSTPSSAPEPFTDTVKPLPTENKPTEKKAVEETVEIAIANEPALARFQGLSAPRNQLATTRLERFGAGLFAGQPTTFAPTNDAPVPLNYLLGPGDQLIIELFGSKNERFNLMLDRGGLASIPRVGTVNLSGLTFEEAQIVLKKRLESLGVGIDPVITMGEMRSFRIFVMGEARMPGSYMVSGMASITHALYISGGISNIGSFRNIELRRQGELVSTLDLYDLLTKGDTTGDVRLQPGDTVFIPVQGKQISLMGEVNRPALYEVKDEKTFQDMVSLAGGLTSKAYAESIKVTRIQDNGFATVLGLNLNKPSDLNSRFHNGDLVNVPGVVDELDSVVSLIGQVQRPGVYPWFDGMILQDLLPNVQIFKRDADLGYVVILRQENPSSAPTVLNYSWMHDLSTPVIKSDRVFVLSKKDKDQRKQILKNIEEYLKTHTSIEDNLSLVEILGEVIFPGVYPIGEGVTLRDILNISGGLKTGVDQNYILVRSEDKEGGIVFKSYAYLEAADVQITARDKVYVFSNLAENDKSNLDAQRLDAQRLDAQRLDAQRLDSKSSNEFLTSYRSEIISGDITRLLAQSSNNKPAQIVSVSGYVKFPGTYPLEKGSRVSDIIVATGGLMFHSVSTEADLIRSSIVNGEERQTEVQTINLNAVMQGDQQANLFVQPGDQIIIKRVANWQDSARTILIEGEVRFPGAYTIQSGETLESVLVRAGGFTQWAAPKNAVFLRESLREQEKRELEYAANELEKNLLMSVKADAGFYKTDPSAILQMGNALVERLRATPALGRLVVGLDPSNELRYKTTMGMTLEDGDRLVIPSRPTEVVVTGEVLRSVSFIYQQDKSVGDYIQMAGGVTRRADNKSIFVVQGDGSIEQYKTGLFSSNNIKLQPGATIVIPMDVERVNPLLTWNSVASILANFAVTAATLKTIGVIN